jgi:hypothetical protein
MHVVPALEVLNVSVPEQLPDGVRAARIRIPEPGATSDGFTLELSGTVITAAGPARAVELTCNGMPVREVPVDITRTGLAQEFPDLPDELRCGFRSLVGTLLLPAEFELELIAIAEDGRRFPIGSITGRRAHPSPSVEPRLRALMVTSVGRTGTVLLMRMLAAHPSVVVHPAGRYEVWPARYWAHMLAVLSAPADHMRSAAPFGFDHDLWHVGQNPFATAGPSDGALGAWLGRAHVDRLASFCLANVEDWYAIAAREQGKEPVYFAEKNLLRTSVQGLGVSDLYPEAGEVFLVRDFRDVACSMFSFLGDKWRADGYDTDRALRELVAPLVQHLVSGWRARGEHAHLVRYEDLALTPRDTLAGMFRYLGIDSSDAAVDDALRSGADERSFSGHGTSATIEQSVGRWEREGDESFRDTLNEVLHESLVEFGYAEAPAEHV